MFFLHSWRSLVLSGIIFLQCGELPLAYIYLSQVFWWWIILFFIYLKMHSFHSHFYRIFLLDTELWVDNSFFFSSPRPIKMLFCHQSSTVSNEKSLIFQPIPLWPIQWASIHLAILNLSLYSFASLTIMCLFFVFVDHWAAWSYKLMYLIKFGKISGIIYSKLFFSTTA